MTLPVTLDEAIKRHVAQALLATGGNLSRAARSLGISRTTMSRMMGRNGWRPVPGEAVMLETVRHYAENPPSIEEKA